VNPVLDPSDYEQAATELERRVWNTSAWCFSLLAMSSLLLSVGFDLAPWADRQGNSGLVMFVGTTACVGAPLLSLTFVLGLVILARRVRGMAEDARTKCPHCGTGLALVRRIVLTRRTCPNCGRSVFDDPGPARLRTRAEVDAVVRWYGRSLRRAVTIVAIACVWWGFLFGMILVLRFVPALLTTVNLALIGPPAVMLWIIFRVSGQCPDGRLRNVRLTCPHCGRGFDPNQVYRVNECRRCGRPILADPPPVGMAAESPSG
jgi:DNA-directed RNA polymerase subunit RPC12/RpoP